MRTLLLLAFALLLTVALGRDYPREVPTDIPDEFMPKNQASEIRHLMYAEYINEYEQLRKYNWSFEALMADAGVKYKVAPFEMVPLRDGVHVLCRSMLPILPNKHGFMLERTTYTIHYIWVMAVRWVPLGFGAILCDQRGAGYSRQDRFRFWRNDGPDAYDIMQYFVSNDWSNQKVYLTGLSSMAIAMLAGLLNEPPWALAMGPTVGTGNGYATVYQGGVFRTAIIRNWLAVLGFVVTIQEVKDNEVWTLDYWDPITLPGKENLCHIPGVHSTGWFDLFLNEHIDGFNGVQYGAISDCRGQHKMVVGPHGHCTFGEYMWPDSLPGLPLNMRMIMFLEIEGLPVPNDLRKKVAAANDITFYVMGGRNAKVGNYWHTRKHWPVENFTPYYLQPNNALSTTAPSTTSYRYNYTYNPLDPVLTHGGNEFFLPCGPRDQSRSHSRKDVVGFTTAPLTAPLAIVGNVSAVLYVSTDALDTDFTAKLMDVYPSGEAFNIVDGIKRLKWRNQPETPTQASPPLDARPNEIYEITLSLWKTAYIFETGHSVRVDISSSNHPRFEKNLNNGRLLNEGGVPVSAFNTFYTDKGHPSRVILPVVNINDIPQNWSPIYE